MYYMYSCMIRFLCYFLRFVAYVQNVCVHFDHSHYLTSNLQYVLFKALSQHTYPCMRYLIKTHMFTKTLFSLLLKNQCIHVYNGQSSYGGITAME